MKRNYRIPLMITTMKTYIQFVSFLLLLDFLHSLNNFCANLLICLGCFLAWDASASLSQLIICHMHGWHNYNKRTYSLFFLFFSVVWTMLCSCFLLLTRSDGVLAFSSACNDSHAWAHAKNNECMHACMHTTWFCRLFNSSIHNMLCLHAIMQLLLYTEMSLCSYLTAVKVKPFL